MQLKFNQITVFVGRNSVGKSNIIESLLFVRDCLDRGLDYATSERHGVDSIFQWSRFRPYNLDIQMKFKRKSGFGTFNLKLGSKKREPVVLHESMNWFDTSQQTGVSYKVEGDRVETDGFDDVSGERLRQVLAQRMGPDNLFLPQIQFLPSPNYRLVTEIIRSVRSVNAYSIFPNTIKNPQKPSSEYMLLTNGENITSILKDMASSNATRTKSRYQEIISLMKKIIPNLERILVRNLSGLLWLNFEVSESDGRNHQLNVSQISDGALRVLGILVALYQPNPPDIVAIEEPEQNLHPGALGLLADAFKDRARDTQIILTTHSPHLIDHFDVDNLRSVTLKDNLTVVQRISAQQTSAIKSGLLSAGEVMVSQDFY
jgi:predicted ATPase